MTAAIIVAGALLCLLGVAAGWPAADYLAAHEPAAVRVPFAFALGICQSLFSINALSYVLPVPASFVAGAAVGLLLPWAPKLVRGWRFRPAAWRWGWGSWRANVALAVLVGSAGYLAGAAALWRFVWDEPEDHWINVATIAQGNFYPRLAFAPDKAMQYHYGFDLLAAAVQRLSGLPVWWSIDVVTLALAPMLAWLGVATGWLLTRNRAAALLTSAFFFYGGGLRATLLGHALGEWLRAVQQGGGFWEAIQQTPPPFNDVYDPFIWGVHDHNRALATAAILATALALRALLREPAWTRAALVGALIGLTALVSETDFVILLAATVGLGALVWVRFICNPTAAPRRGTSPRATAAAGDGSQETSPRGTFVGGQANVVRSLVAAAVVAVAVAFTQGGLLTDALWRNPHDNPQTAFALRWPPGIPRFQMPALGPGAPGWISGVVSEFGLMLVLAPAAMAYAARRRDPLLTWLVVGGATGILLPAFVAYPFLDHDLSRFAVTGTRLFMLAAAPVWLWLWAGPWAPQARPLVRAGAVGAVAASAVGPLAIALYLLPPGGGMVAQAPELKGGATAMEVGAFLRQATPPRARVLTDAPQELAALSGRMAPSDKTLHSLGLGRDVDLYHAALNSLDAEALRRLGIDYVAVSAARWRVWPAAVRQELITGRRFLRVTTFGEQRCDGDWAALYQVAGAPLAPRVPVADNPILNSAPCQEGSA